jgi:hypothetical protein
LKHSKQVIVVSYSQQVNDQRPVPQDLQRRGSEISPLRTVRQAVAKHPPRRPAGLAVLLLIVLNLVVEEALYAFWTFESSQNRQLLTGQTGVVHAFSRSSHSFVPLLS